MIGMDVDADLYDRDFVAWTEVQAERLRAAARTRSNLPIDWEQVAEEIEDLGKGQRHKLESRLRTIVAHLLKLQFSPAEEPRFGWIETVVQARDKAHHVLKNNPSLRPQLGMMLADALKDGRQLAQTSLRAHGEREASDRVSAAAAFTEDQILGDWLPRRTEEPGPGRRARPGSRSRRA
jgi:hypothetical protein